MKEKAIELYFVKKVKAMGGMAIKFVSPGFDGLPDRLVLLPKNKLAFVELKAPGKKPRALQIKRMEQLTSFGFKCFVADTKEAVDATITELGGDAQ